MKVLKENLTLVICGAIVLLAGAIFWYAWWPMRTKVTTDMSSRMGEKSNIEMMINNPLDFPPGETQHGPPTEELISMRETWIKSLNDQQKQVIAESVRLNSQGRVNGKDPVLPLATGAKVERGFLPRNTGPNPIAFKEDYKTMFRLWMAQLATGDTKEGKDLDFATPPDDTAIKAEYDARVAAQPVPGGGLGQVDPKAELNYKRSRVLSKAAELRMYLDPGAFQIRTWALGPEPPNEQQIFEALVDSWLQSDVVKAISTVNASVVPAPGKDISKSPVKRLIHIMVGNGARAKVGQAPGLPFSLNQPAAVLTGTGTSEGGDLFFTSQSAQGLGAVAPPVPVDGGGAAPVAAAPNAVDYNLSMTGHSSGGDYDVVLMSIWMDIDPAYLNRFKDQLYHQNMGYTVIGERFKTVDPLERTSNGFIYGEGQAIEVQLQVEAILFRGWTTPLMPDAVKAALGVAPAAAAQ